MTSVIERIDTQSPSPTDELMGRLRAAVPEYFTEGELDTERLLAMLGHMPDGKPDRYSFTWAGKRDAIRALQTPSGGTLAPVPEESVNWDTTQHLFIEGDNLEVLKLLYKAYFGKVKLIYIDPPYNTGNDFVYPDDFADPLGRYLEITGQKDAEGNWATSNPETSGRYHSAWLSMMYPRLFMARQLLRQDGVICVSIDSNELANLISILDEIFGSENREAIISWRRRHNQPNDKSKMIAKVSEFIVVYARSSEFLKQAKTYYGVPLSADRMTDYSNADNDPRGPWTTNPWKAARGRGGSTYAISTPTGKSFLETWYGNKETFETLLKEKRVHFTDGGNGYPRIKIFLSEAIAQGQPAIDFFYHDKEGNNQEASAELAEIMGVEGLFDNPKPVKLLATLARVTTSNSDLILDFFSGTSSMGQAVVDLNASDGARRRYILIQLPELLEIGEPAYKAGFRTISDLGKERMRRVSERRRRKLPLIDTADTLMEDAGFRVFKLGPSTLRDWHGTIAPTTDEYVNQLTLLSEPLHEGWRAEDVVWEVAIKEGYPLTSEVTSAAVAGQEVWRVADLESGRAFHVCLDDAVGAEVAPALGLGREDLLVVRDAAVDDTVAANLALQCRLKTL